MIVTDFPLKGSELKLITLHLFHFHLSYCSGLDPDSLTYRAYLYLVSTATTSLMRPGLVPASSPTPYHEDGPPTSLIPSSPSGRFLHRNRLERASSHSVGHVTAAGLSTWKRKSRKNSSADGLSKKGLGMGMEATPGRRKKSRQTKVCFPSPATPSPSSSSDRLDKA